MNSARANLECFCLRTIGRIVAQISVGKLSADSTSTETFCCLNSQRGTAKVTIAHRERGQAVQFSGLIVLVDTIKDCIPKHTMLCTHHRLHWYATSEIKTADPVSKISDNHTCYRHIGSKSTNHSRLALHKKGQKVILVALIGGFRFDLLRTRKTDDNLGNVSPKCFDFWSRPSM